MMFLIRTSERCRLAGRSTAATDGYAGCERLLYADLVDTESLEVETAWVSRPFPLVAAALLALLAAASLPATASAGLIGGSRAASVTSHLPATSPADKGYRFRTLDNPADPTYNALTGINNAGVISGYYGSGSSAHPSQG